MTCDSPVYLAQIKDMDDTLGRLIDEVPVEQFNQRPGPRLNPIGWNHFHLLRIWDLDLNWMCKGQMPEEDAWHRGGFSEKTGYYPDGKGGLSLGLGYGYSDDEVDEIQIEAEILKEYQRMLMMETEAYLSDASEDEMCRQTPSLLNPDQMRSGAERFQHLIAHSYGHIGEIRYAMGMLGWSDPSYPGSRI
jgi:hypothetical protein